MIQFNETSEKKDLTELLSSPAIKAIIPERLSPQEARGFWDNLFAENAQSEAQEINEDDLWEEIFEEFLGPAGRNRGQRSHFGEAGTSRKITEGQENSFLKERTFNVHIILQTLKFPLNFEHKQYTNFLYCPQSHNPFLSTIQLVHHYYQTIQHTHHTMLVCFQKQLFVFYL